MLGADVPLVGVGPALFYGVRPNPFIEGLLSARFHLHRHAHLPSALVARNDIALDNHVKTPFHFLPGPSGARLQCDHARLSRLTVDILLVTRSENSTGGDEGSSIRAGVKQPEIDRGRAAALMRVDARLTLRSRYFFGLPTPIPSRRDRLAPTPHHICGACERPSHWGTSMGAGFLAPTLSSTMGIRSSAVQGEKRWPMAITLLVAMALPFLLPARFSLGPRWIIPAVEALLLVALVVADPGRIDRRSTFIRALSLGLVFILVFGAAAVTIRLVVDLIRGGPETNSPGQLLRVGWLTWVYVIISFSFLYWELDGGGPEARSRATPEYPDLAFPEHLNPLVTRPGWRPEYFDYLYLAFTNALAFSPTDVMPLSRWAKLAMAIEATASLIIVGLVIARAVNILK